MRIGPWWFAFHQTPNLPEFLVEGKEREYISWFFKGSAYNPSAITEEDIDIFANHFSTRGTARSAFEYFRAFPVDAEQNKESAKTKITIPVLALGGDIYPALGGDIPGNFAAKLITIFIFKCNWNHCSTFGTLDSRRTTILCNRPTI